MKKNKKIMCNITSTVEYSGSNSAINFCKPCGGSDFENLNDALNFSRQGYAFCVKGLPDSRIGLIQQPNGDLELVMFLNDSKDKPVHIPMGKRLTAKKIEEIYEHIEEFFAPLLDEKEYGAIYEVYEEYDAFTGERELVVMPESEAWEPEHKIGSKIYTWLENYRFGDRIYIVEVDGEYATISNKIRYWNDGFSANIFAEDQSKNYDCNCYVYEYTVRVDKDNNPYLDLTASTPYEVK